MQTDWAKIQQDLAEVLSQQTLKQHQTIADAQAQALDSYKILLEAFRKFPEIQVSDAALEALRGFNLTASVTHQARPTCATLSSPQLAALELYSWLAVNTRSKRARRRNRAKSKRLLRGFSDPREAKQMIEKYRQYQK